ncbi:MAG: LicD family protein [Sulfitobacter sp.]
MIQNDALDHEDQADLIGIRDAAMQHQLDGRCRFDGRQSRRIMAGIKARIEPSSHPEYLEAMILTRLIGGAPPRRVKRPLQDLYFVQCARGQVEEFDRFKAHLIDVHAKGKLSGDLVFQGSLADWDHADLWERTRRTIEHVKSLVGEVWLNSGTLLGSIRDGGFIGHDNDIDLAVMMQGETPQEVAGAWIEACHTLRASGLKFHVPARNKRVMKVIDDGMQIDLFPAWMQGDQVFVYPHTAGQLRRDDLLPFGKCAASGLPIPRNPQAFLELNYGPKWRVPDPSFTFDWPTSEQHFEAFKAALYADVDAFEPREKAHV